ncbi:hypothetical protein CWS43_24425 [Rahnella sp. AA]|uniref:serine/threonine protein kinase n=1 Tax=Rahnella sp. AA TaxID=2057180 RepID=UPI000C320EC4|nr:protein kinase [Rahnella sp. AA]PKE27827.1 hypothetical protein CWS43_24425 [Rahnella sp. AA]
MENLQKIKRLLNEKSFSGKYELLNQIKEGLFSTVFKAKDKISHQDVVIKSLHFSPDLDKVEKLTRIASFEQECQITSRLSHPNIIRFLSRNDISGDSPFVIFEYVNGISLDEHLKLYGALGAEAAITIMSQIMDAIRYIHSCGIIHCDIKPSNIILSERAGKPHAVLLDFGISILSPALCRKEFHHRPALSQARSGTPGYCSPEQLRGENVTYRSDFYMWGLVFLECLTGVPAISGSTLGQLYYQSLSTAPVSIPAALLAHPLGYLLHKVLRKEPSERTSDAARLLNDLGQIAIDDLAGDLPLKIQPHEEKPTIDLYQIKQGK